MIAPRGLLKALPVGDWPDDCRHEENNKVEEAKRFPCNYERTLVAELSRGHPAECQELFCAGRGAGARKQQPAASSHSELAGGLRQVQIRCGRGAPAKSLRSFPSL